MARPDPKDEMRRLVDKINKAQGVIREYNGIEQKARLKEAEVIAKLFEKIHPLMPLISTLIPIEKKFYNKHDPVEWDTWDYKEGGEKGILILNRFGLEENAGAKVYTGDQVWYTEKGNYVWLDRHGDADESHDITWWKADIAEIQPIDILDFRYEMAWILQNVNKAFDKAFEISTDRLGDRVDRIQNLDHMIGILNGLKIEKAPVVEDPPPLPEADELLGLLDAVEDFQGEQPVAAAQPPVVEAPPQVAITPPAKDLTKAVKNYAQEKGWVKPGELDEPEDTEEQPADVRNAASLFETLAQKEKPTYDPKTLKKATRKVENELNGNSLAKARQFGAIQVNILKNMFPSEKVPGHVAQAKRWAIDRGVDWSAITMQAQRLSKNN